MEKKEKKQYSNVNHHLLKNEHKIIKIHWYVLVMKASDYDIVVNCESKIQKGFSEGLSAQWQVQEQLKGLIKL